MGEHSHRTGALGWCSTTMSREIGASEREAVAPRSLRALCVAPVRCDQRAPPLGRGARQRGRWLGALGPGSPHTSTRTRPDQGCQPALGRMHSRQRDRFGGGAALRRAAGSHKFAWRRRVVSAGSTMVLSCVGASAAGGRDIRRREEAQGNGRRSVTPCPKTCCAPRRSSAKVLDSFGHPQTSTQARTLNANRCCRKIRSHEFPPDLDKSRDLGRCLSSGSANFCCCGRSVVLAATCALGWSVKARCRPHRPPQRGALDFQPAGNMVGFQGN